MRTARTSGIQIPVEIRYAPESVTILYHSFPKKSSTFLQFFPNLFHRMISEGNDMKEIAYNRSNAVKYARIWALERNENYYDFENIGGDCTNFVSQCVYTGAKVMNYTKIYGWYYNTISDRAPAWTSVRYFHQFLTKNKGIGPYGEEVGEPELLPGDVIQLGKSDGHFYHSLLVSQIYPEILVCAHSYDALDRPLSTYSHEEIRFLHIIGVRI